MSLFGSLSVSASGMDAQRQRAEVLAENLANSETTRTPEGGPYRRKDVVFQSTTVASPFASEFQSALDNLSIHPELVCDLLHGLTTVHHRLECFELIGWMQRVVQVPCRAQSLRRVLRVDQARDRMILSD